jgi:chromate transporter
VVQAALWGIRACVVGLILQAVLKLGKPAVRDIWGWVIAVAAFALAVFVNVSAVWVILGAALAGLLLHALRGRAKR